MNQLQEQVKVGIADVAIAKSSQALITSGLGSCVGIILYDESLKNS
ncbi:hypothetical protein [Piscibacillus salipiscarius]